MGQALYRKYRSKKLNEIVGQEHITDTLTKALEAGRINHAYLFTGPRGVGKTSIARILAHEINGLPYESDQPHLDIIEIDAASNRRIDEIRELRDKVAVAPTSAKYKVYIIDEVHMLTREAFNALLKTLEEPPAHVVFILATTDAHRLPETIVSRTQRFSFRPVAMPKVVAHLRSIASDEGLDIDDEALQLLAEHGEGSFRDSISMLDQAGASGQKISKQTVETLLGVPSLEAITHLVGTLAGGSSRIVSQSLTGLFEQGYQAAGIAASIAGQLRTQIIEGTLTIPEPQAFALLETLLDVPAARDPERSLELALLKVAAGNNPIAPAAPAIVIEAKTMPVSEKPARAPKKVPQQAAPKPAEVRADEKVIATVDAALWPQILSQLKQRYNTLYGVVRMANPQFDGNGLTLAFSFAFHQKRLNEPKNKKILADIIQDLSGKSIRIECIVDKDAKPAPSGGAAIKPAAAPADVSAISNIFGGGELLQ